MPDVEGGGGETRHDMRGVLPAGTTLRGYELKSILGQGAFGITYRARDITLHRDVAIKEYLPTSLALREGRTTVVPRSADHAEQFAWGRERFLDEARTLARLDRTPAIVRVHDYLEANGTAYMVMALIEGETLSKRLTREQRLAPETIERLVFPLLDGLEEVHAAGFLHRDIKPANVLIREEGDAVLIDFGAARRALETRKQGLTSIYTEGYAPLEQYDTTGNQGPWTDIYALGGVAYKCLTGKKPPSATSRLRNDPLVPVAIAVEGRVSPDFAEAIDAALRIDENLRPQTIGEFAAIISGAHPSPDDAATRLARTHDEATRIIQPIIFPPSGMSQRTVSQAPSQSQSRPATAPAEVRGKGSVYLGVAAAMVIVLVPAAGWFYLQSASPSRVVAEAGETAAIVPAPAPVTAPDTTNAAPPPQPAAGPAAPASTPPPPKETAEAPPAPKPPPAAAKPAESPPVTANAVGSQTASVGPPRPPAIRASFDCAKAGNGAERLVCSDRQLAELDVKMAYLYALGLNSVVDKNVFSGEQTLWLPRRDSCSSKECLVTAYNDRIKELERWMPR